VDLDDLPVPVPVPLATALDRQFVPYYRFHRSPRQ
jgi:hypothetical protein